MRWRAWSSVWPPRSTPATRTPGSTWSRWAARSPSATRTRANTADSTTRATSAIRWSPQARANAARPGGSSGARSAGRVRDGAEGAGASGEDGGVESVTRARGNYSLCPARDRSGGVGTPGVPELTLCGGRRYPRAPRSLPPRYPMTAVLEDRTPSALREFTQAWLAEHLPAGWMDAVDRDDVD